MLNVAPAQTRLGCNILLAKVLPRNVSFDYIVTCYDIQMQGRMQLTAALFSDFFTNDSLRNNLFQNLNKKILS